MYPGVREARPPECSEHLASAQCESCAGYFDMLWSIGPNGARNNVADAGASADTSRDKDGRADAGADMKRRCRCRYTLCSHSQTH